MRTLARRSPIVLVTLLACCARAPRVLEWTGAHDAPVDLGWSTVIAGPDQPGERLRIAGRVLREDGSPVAGALLYVYHADAGGSYPRRGDERGNARRHGYLRGWMRTDGRGRYALETIRPGPYPGRDDPAHVHATVTEPGGRERWVDSFWFAGDPRITPEQLARREGRGGPGAVVSLTRDEHGVWHGRRDLVLADWPWHEAER